MEISLPDFSEPVAFRFFAEFDIKIKLREIRGFTSQQLVLLQAIVASPGTLRRVARMALETELAEITGSALSDLFKGPDNEDIVKCVLPCLSEADKFYWEALRAGPGDSLHQELMPVFLAFAVSLRRAGIDELNAVVEPLRKTVGPIIDASDLEKR